MEKYVALIDFRKKINKIEQSQSGKFEIYDKIIKTCRTVLSGLRQEVLSKGFTGVKSELEFFKEKKQLPLMTLIYYLELYNLEMFFPKGDVESQKRYIQKKIGKVNRFFKTNSDFVQYTIMGYNHMDILFFTRKELMMIPNCQSGFYHLDKDFNTSHDLLLAKISAFEKLLIHLKNRLKNLGSYQLPVKSNLQWTASKVSLTELIYALQLSNSINHGDAGIKQIADCLQKAFNFDLGNYYRIYSEIRQRKKSRTRFLDKLSFSIINQFEKDDGIFCIKK